MFQDMMSYEWFDNCNICIYHIHISCIISYIIYQVSCIIYIYIYTHVNLMGYIEYPKGSKMASDPGDIATLTVSRGYDPNNDDYDVRSAVIQPLEMDQVGQLGGSAPFGGKHGRIAIEKWWFHGEI